jgi:hypothetical protein
MANKKTIETKTAEAILQSGSETFTVAGQDYEVSKPTVATVIMCSELISQMPEVRDVQAEYIVHETLRVAKDTKIIGRIAAVLILGAKRVLEHRKVTVESVEIDETDYIAQNILLEYSPTELEQLITGRLYKLEIGSFFGITTSLADANVLKPTRKESEVVD